MPSATPRPCAMDPWASFVFGFVLVASVIAAGVLIARRMLR